MVFSCFKSYLQLTIVFSWRHLYYGKIAHIFFNYYNGYYLVQTSKDIES